MVIDTAEIQKTLDENPVCGCFHCGSGDCGLRVEDEDERALFAMVCKRCYCSGPVKPSVRLAIQTWNMVERPNTWASIMRCAALERGGQTEMRVFDLHYHGAEATSDNAIGVQVTSGKIERVVLRLTRRQAYDLGVRLMELTSTMLSTVGGTAFVVNDGEGENGV